MRGIATTLICGGLVLAMAAGASGLTVVNPGESIQAAINAEPVGGTVFVKAGTYSETLVINKPITLTGEDKASTILTWTGALVEQHIFLGGNTGLTIPGNVVIENFTIANGGSLTGDKDLIKFRAKTDGAGTITIRNNIFDGIGGGPYTAVKAIEESRQGGDFLITGNEFHNCSYAIWANSLHSGTVSDNLFRNASLGMGGSGGPTDAPRDLVFSGNTMDGSKYAILFANNIHDIDFLGNTIMNSTYGGLVWWDYGPVDFSGVEFHCNAFSGNVVGAGMYVGSTMAGPGTLPVLINAEGNYWGAADGPRGLYGGSGDSVLLTNLDVDPWRTTPCVPQVIPEPVTLLALLAGAGSLVGYVRRRRA